MIIYREWGINSLGFPEGAPKEVNLDFSGGIPEGWQEVSQEDLDVLILANRDLVTIATNQLIEQGRLNSTYVMTGEQWVDENLAYNLVLARDNILYEKISNKRTVTTLYTKGNVLAIREYKIYDYSGVTNYPNVETLQIDYYNLSNEVKHTKTLITNLCFADSEKAQVRINTAKLINVKKLIVDRKLSTSNPVSISILSSLVISQSSAFIDFNLPNSLLDVFNDFTNYVNGLIISNEDKANILVLFDSTLITSIIGIIND